uniref:hypothetical protein n=1 Tax=Flavobacterium sp. TaxID=239 RepID=UPI0040491F67
MKKVLVVAMMLVGITTFAQGKGDKREPLTPEQQTELHIKKMTLDLDLNEKQKNAIKPILLEEAKKREAQKAERKTKKEKEEKASKAERYEMKSKILDDQIALKEKMKNILTTEQMEKWETLKEDKKDKMQQKRRNHKKKE